MTTTNDTTKQLTAGIAAITTARRLTKEAFESASFAAGALGLDTDTKDNRGNPAKPGDIERALREAHGAAERAVLNLAHALGLPKVDAPAPMADVDVITRARAIVEQFSIEGGTRCNLATTLDDLDMIAQTLRTAPACTVSDILGGGR